MREPKATADHVPLIIAGAGCDPLDKTPTPHYMNYRVYMSGAKASGNNDISLRAAIIDPRSVGN